MESKNLIYKNGHFYDKHTKHRLDIADDAELTIVALEGCFLKTEPVGTWFTDEPLDSASLEKLIAKDPVVGEYKKIMDAGKRLYVHITHNGKYYQFEVLLKEDLYVYLPVKSKKDEGKLYDCACIVTANTNKGIEFFEEIKGKSLNEVYKNTFVHYFGNKGNPACNALDRFYEFPNDEDSTIGKHRKIEKKAP